MISINSRLHNELLVLIATLCLFMQPNAALADSSQRCVTLEHSNLTSQQLEISGYYSLALSRDRQLIALYQDFTPKELVTFKLWSSKTGKLQKSRKMTNFKDSGIQGHLNFSPDNSLIYYAGMGPGVPLWNLAKNKVVLSPCETAMGITKVEFSDDVTVAYTVTTDGFRSLCRTDKPELLASIGYAHGTFYFDKKTKHLHGTFASTDKKSYQFDQQKIDGLTAAERQHISVTMPQPSAPPAYNADSDDSFVGLLLGSPPHHRWLTAESRGSSLILNLWDHRQQYDPPLNSYQRTFNLPELTSGKQQLANAKIISSPDEKQAAFLSRSGVLVVFDIASGQLRWKKQLPQLHAQNFQQEPLENYFLSYEQTVPEVITIEQREPETLMFFDWQTGEKRVTPALKPKTKPLNIKNQQPKAALNNGLLLDFHPWLDTEWHLSKQPKFFYDKRQKKIRFCRLFD